MSFAFSARRAVVFGFAFVVALGAVGCKPTVREDRTIHVDANGRAAFQHGQNGVFVTDPKTGAPKRIYDPTPDDIATSPPAFEPGGKRMVFTVARALDGKPRALLGDAPADGRRYSETPVRYTCFLHDPSAPDSKPQKLFEAVVGHAGYVAAGLAVSWHPTGTQLDFVERTDKNKHHVRTFDVAAKTVGDVALPSAENVALGSAPDRPSRYAMLGGAGSDSGLWVEGANGWWRVPESVPQTAHLEHLRRQLPRWARDGTKLAFTTGEEVRVCEVAARNTETWYHSAQITTDKQHIVALHWHPVGKHVGVLDGARLNLVAQNGNKKALTEKPVVAFAGWNADGTRLAFTANEPLAYTEGAKYATLFVPNGHARTALCVADADGANEKVLISGLRATFPHWSPNEKRISVWLTVEPLYRLAVLDPNGLRPGDPAALVDPETGALEWLPVNGTEHAQIGHVDLRSGRIDSALKRFDEAAKGLGANEKTDWMAFRAIALQKAGRAKDAKEAWARFALPEVRPAAPPAQAQQPAAIMSAGVVTSRHRFIAEAYVSLEMASDGGDYFREEVKSAGTDSEKLSAALALGQLLLLTDRKADYAECVTEHLLPLADKLIPTATTGREMLSATVAETMLPLASKDFVAALPEAAVRQVSEKLAAPKDANDVHYVCQLALRECGRRLKDAKLIESAKAKLANHPSQGRWNLTNDEVGVEALTRVRVTFVMLEALADAFGSGEPALRPVR